MPQGTAWELVLFYLFIKDIEIGMKSFVSVFAVDTKICKKINLAQDVASLQ